MSDFILEAPRQALGQNVLIGKGTSIRAEEVVLGDGVQIGDNVDITCDRLELAPGCKIGSGTKLLAPEITLGEGCSIGRNTEAELNQYLRLGKLSVIGSSVVIAGQGVSSGDYLWLKNSIIIGGGGCSGPNSYLHMGHGVTIIDKCYINLSEEVTIGDNVALSYNVVVLTHGAWQPVLYGFPAQFGPVRIGSGSVIYLNSVILPGVTLGEHVTIGAQSLVNRDVPAHHLAAGTPAKVVKNMESFSKPLPQQDIDRILTEVLADYATTLPPKEVELLELRTEGNPVFVRLAYNGKTHSIAYYKGAAAAPEKLQADISLSFRPIDDAEKGAAHFNLQSMEIEGELDLVGEDLRDYIRRRAIRFLNGKPFKTIVIANIKRLRARRAGA